MEQEIEQIKQTQKEILQRLLALEKPVFEDARESFLTKQSDILQAESKLEELGVTVKEPIIPLTPEE